jgi:hypothetical protein
VRSLDGQVLLFFSDGILGFINPDAPEYRGTVTMKSLFLGQPEREFRLLGFAYVRGLWPRPTDSTSGGFSLRPYRMLAVPYWALTFAAGVPAVVIWRRRRRTQRWVSLGRCAGCGYDIRFSSGQCPECGLPLALPTPAPADELSPETR